MVAGGGAAKRGLSRWDGQWVEAEDPKVKQRILDYNEDDCRAMRVLIDRMREMEIWRHGD